MAARTRSNTTMGFRRVYLPVSILTVKELRDFSLKHTSNSDFVCKDRITLFNPIETLKLTFTKEANTRVIDR